MFQLPDGARGAGALQISVTVDTFNQTARVQRQRTGEANNTAVIAAASAIAPYPDLQIANLAIEPAVLVSGTNLTSRWQDTNSGNAVTPANWHDRLTIINTNLGLTLLDTTVPYDANSLGPLTNGTARNRSLNFTLPNNSNGAGGLLFHRHRRYLQRDLRVQFRRHWREQQHRFYCPRLEPDAAARPVISSLTFSNSAFTDQILSARLRLANQGLAGVTPAWCSACSSRPRRCPAAARLRRRRITPGRLGSASSSIKP